ncbi:peptidoglycan recognition protein family protein [Streptomyces gilvus]|uniref:peptidoglycan recognition protein family protein n=1 Tax=Streptomyces gilvus TaxID=2920937 RepID=UPI001F10DB7A|nr:peptidoglycan recognition protein [Streptomyces sp. CME 23]MCH5673784.1 peptidoglycan recognition protein [Streptomyces sp. CME 23]
MRGFLASTIASSIGVSCAAALVLPLAAPATAAPTSPASPPGARSARPAALPGTPDAAVPGSTQSLALAPVARDRALGPAVAEQGLTREHVRHFSLLGVVWDDPGTPLHGRVQVRTRSTRDGAWSGWRNLETHNDDAADPGAAERASHRVRGATPPLWVGDSDGVEVRVRAESGHRTGGTAHGARAGTAAGPLPSGLRLELVDPGAPPPARAARPGATEIPALTKAATEDELRTLPGVELTPRQRANPHIGPRPRIITRRGWGADEKLRERGFVYTKKVKAAFVHHTASGNGYKCSQAASVIRGIHRYHVRSMRWRDIGYNFLVDKCGTLYEGRAGGVAKPVLGAHTRGFNTNSMGIAVLGGFGSAKPPKAVLDAIARLTAWKLGLYGADPRGKTYLTSGGGNLYRKGKSVRLNVISGHRDGFATQCPGRKLYSKLGTARSTAARYQGR